MDFAHYWFQDQANGVNPDLIPGSLRFKGNGWLRKNWGSAQSSTTSTVSFWFKRGRMCQNWKTYQCLLGSNDVWRFVHSGGNDEDLMYSGSVSNGWSSKEKYRDPSAWYHHVLVWNTSSGTAADRLILYINGVRRPVRNGANPGQNVNKQYFNNQWTYIGCQNNASSNEAFDGLMAEFHHIDGQALGPETFGEFDKNGIWIPKKPSGLSYGTNGFYLDFQDPSQPGKDVSGRGNHHEASNFNSDPSSTAYDFFSDSPTRNYNNLNPLQITNPGRNSITIEANHRCNHDNELSTCFPMDTRYGGKYYAEVTVLNTVGSGEPSCGIFNQSKGNWRDGAGRGDTAYSWMYKGDRNKRNNGQQSGYGGDWKNAGAVVGILLDLDNRQLSFTLSGSNQGVAYSNLPDGIYTFETAANGGRWEMNFNAGERPFKYSIPSGYMAQSARDIPGSTLPTTITGTFQGNGNSDGPYIHTGCLPGRIQYGSVDVTYGNRLNQNNVDFYANGFKLRSGTSNSGTVSFTVTTTHSDGPYNGKQVPFGGKGVNLPPGTEN